MARSLFISGAVRTTEAKAKDLRRFVERLITCAARGTLQARRRVLRELGDREIVDAEGEPTGKTVVQKLFDEIAPRYGSRPGGYTRIIRLPERRIGDGGRTVMVQLVEEEAAGGAGAKTASGRKRRAAKRHEAAAAVEEAEAEPAPEGEEDETAGEPTAEQDEGAEEQEEPAEEDVPEEQRDEGDSADEEAKDT
jgi:large subunit ribosomal protein L17